MEVKRKNTGIFISVAWVAFWLVVLYAKGPDEAKMDLNEWGDFMAGMFAPLAFLWLVLGYMQQGEELKQNTEALLQQEEALRLQVEELRQSVEQQRGLVEAANRQVDIDQAAVHQELRREAEQLQPSWELTRVVAVQTSDAGTVGKRLDFTNNGANVTDVLAFSEEPVVVALNPPAYVINGHTFIIVLTYPAESEGGICFGISYKDVKGISQNMSFKYSTDNSNIVTPIPFTPNYLA